MAVPFISTYLPANINVVKGIRKHLVEFKTVSSKAETQEEQSCFQEEQKRQGLPVHAKVRSDQQTGNTGPGQIFRHHKLV